MDRTLHIDQQALIRSEVSETLRSDVQKLKRAHYQEYEYEAELDCVMWKLTVWVDCIPPTRGCFDTPADPGYFGIAEIWSNGVEIPLKAFPAEVLETMKEHLRG
jgi:hypothetical protein